LLQICSKFVDNWAKIQLFICESFTLPRIDIGFKFLKLWPRKFKYALLECIFCSNFEYIYFPGPVFVTAASVAFFPSLLVLISKWQKFLLSSGDGDAKFVFYDLSLESEYGYSPVNISELQTACKILYRKFPYDKYPRNILRLEQFRWKPLVITVEFWFIYKLLWELYLNRKLSKNSKQFGIWILAFI